MRVDLRARLLPRRSLWLLALGWGAALALPVPAGAQVCGDGICDSRTEDGSSCPIDCRGCGDLSCDPCNESATTCADCFCGDGVCDATETPATCSQDCHPAVSGDLVCDLGESSEVDCASPTPVCRNGTPGDPCTGIGAVLGFEDLSLWKVFQGSMARSLNTKQFTQCAASLQLTGNNFAVIESAQLDTSQLPGPARTLSLDLFIGTQQPNPAWIGQVQLYVNCPSCQLNNPWIDQVELTPLVRGQWVKVSFKLTDKVLEALRQRHGDFTWRLALNANPGSGPYLFDNLRYE